MQQCPYCGRYFKNKQAVKSHQKYCLAKKWSEQADGDSSKLSYLAGIIDTKGIMYYDIRGKELNFRPTIEIRFSSARKDMLRKVRDLISEVFPDLKLYVERSKIRIRGIDAIKIINAVEPYVKSDLIKQKILLFKELLQNLENIKSKLKEEEFFDIEDKDVVVEEYGESKRDIIDEELMFIDEELP